MSQYGGNDNQFIADIVRSGVTSMYNIYLDLSTYSKASTIVNTFCWLSFMVSQDDNRCEWMSFHSYESSTSTDQLIHQFIFV